MDDVILPPMPQEFMEIVHPIDTNKLESYEDHLSAAMEQITRRDSSAWGLADIIHSLVEKFGEQSQTEFADQLKIGRSTVTNYLRTARAFPPNTRIPDISFTHHMEASFADGYNGEEFQSQTRFEWAKLASEQQIGTAHFKNKIHKEKEKQRLQVTYLPCYLCDKGDETVLEFVFISRDPNSSKRSADQFMLHKDCYDTIRGLMDQARTKV